MFVSLLWSRRSLASACLAVASLLAACSGNSAEPMLPVRQPSAATAKINAFTTSAATAIVVNPVKLALFGTGSHGSKTVVVSERGYIKSFLLTSGCAKVATVSPTFGKGPVFRFTVRAIAKGSCSIGIADALHHRATLPVTDRPGGAVAIRLVIPTRMPRKKHGAIAPHYISPSTQAMTVNISGPTNETVVAGLTSLSPGCTLTLEGLDCAFGTSLASCPSAAPCYTATITTYDSYDSSTNTIPYNAAALSISKGTFAILNNATNDVTFNFSGIPANIVVVPANALTTTSGNQIDLVGPGAHPLFAEALDADNNLIAGIGGPSYSISAKGNLAALGLTVVQPPPGSPRFSLTPPKSLVRAEYNSATVTVTATYGPGQTDGCAVQGAVCAGAVTADMQSLLAVSTGLGVEFFAAEKGTGPINTISSGGNVSQALTFDAQGDLYEAESYAGTQGAEGAVQEFGLGAAIPSRTLFSGLSNPIALQTDPAGNLFVLDAGNSSVLEYAPGASAPSATKHVLSSPTAFAVDAKDDVWVGNASGVTFYPKGGAAQALTGLVHPYAMAIDPVNDTLYVSDIAGYPSLCGNPGSSSNQWCPTYYYTYGSTTPQTLSAQGYGGHLAVVHGLGVFADNATGTNLSFYPTFESLPLTSPDYWSGNIVPTYGHAIVADGQGNMYVSIPQDNVVYGYSYASFDIGLMGGADAPYIEISNGLDTPNDLAIAP